MDFQHAFLGWFIGMLPSMVFYKGFYAFFVQHGFYLPFYSNASVVFEHAFSAGFKPCLLLFPDIVSSDFPNYINNANLHMLFYMVLKHAFLVGTFSHASQQGFLACSF